jgi:hypothetical protein
MSSLAWSMSLFALALGSVLMQRGQRHNKRAVSRQRCVSSLARAISPAAVEDKPLADDALHLGERLLGALEAEKRATDRLSEGPRDRARIDDWLACRAESMRIEHLYGERLCLSGADLRVGNPAKRKSTVCG